MPYIPENERYYFKETKFENIKFENKGQLEYCIYKLMKQFMSNRESKYTNLHDCCYAAHHCADEFRRRYLDKREDAAMLENGDI